MNDALSEETRPSPMIATRGAKRADGLGLRFDDGAAGDSASDCPVIARPTRRALRRAIRPRGRCVTPWIHPKTSTSRAAWSLPNGSAMP